jgi:hypothetical protein
MSSESSHRHYPAALPTVDLGSLTPRLKKTIEQTAFTKYCIDEQYVGQRSLSAQERMRVMDRFFLHNPHLEEECAWLNLPSNRLHLHSLKDVMYLSGGLVGVRFESDELKDAGQLLKILGTMWADLDKIYKNMSTSERKLTWTTENTADAVLNLQLQSVSHFHDQCDAYLRHIKILQSLIRKKQSQIDSNSVKGTIRFIVLLVTIVLFYAYDRIAQIRC